jgi:hypothetical protein
MITKAINIPSGSFVAASGPLVFFFFLPTLVGMGGSYFLFLSWEQKYTAGKFISHAHLQQKE